MLINRQTQQQGKYQAVDQQCQQHSAAIFTDNTL